MLHPSRSILKTRAPPKRLLGGMEMLVAKHFLSRAPGSPPLLPAKLGHALRLLRLPPEDPRFDLVQKKSARQKSVQGLRPFLLTTDADPAGPMNEKNAGGRPVHMLSTRPRGGHKGLFKILLPHPEPFHPLDQRLLFGRIDGEHTPQLSGLGAASTASCFSTRRS